MIENASQGKIKCIGTDNIIDARKHLHNTIFDFIMIDYMLGSGFDSEQESYTGYDFYKYVINIYPNMKCIIYSGKNPKTIESEIINIFIAKPFSTDQILNKINNLFKEKNE
jgi:DNA-binding NtrC family response regulator